MRIKVINKSKHQLPQYSRKASASMDLRGNLDNDVVLTKQVQDEWLSGENLLDI